MKKILDVCCGSKMFGFKKNRDTQCIWIIEKLKMYYVMEEN